MTCAPLATSACISSSRRLASSSWPPWMSARAASESATADAVHDVRRRDRLQLEGRVLQSLRHPHICSVYEVGEDADRVFLAMEYVEGISLADEPAVQEAVVAGVPDAYRGETVKAYIVLKEGQQATAEEIVEFCKLHLASFKVPRLVEFRSELPKTMVGKILRRQLVEEEKKKMG